MHQNSPKEDHEFCKTMAVLYGTVHQTKRFLKVIKMGLQVHTIQK